GHCCHAASKCLRTVYGRSRWAQPLPSIVHVPSGPTATRGINEDHRDDWSDSMAVAASGVDHLAVLKSMLLEERQQLLGEAAALTNREREFSVLQKMDDGGGAGSDAADVATEMFEQELALGLAQHVRTHLVDIDDALARIEAGEYGLCEDCGEPIVPERLRPLPRARR